MSTIFSKIGIYLSEQYVKLFQSGGSEEDEVILTGDKLRNIDEFKNMTIKDLLGEPPDLSTSSKNETSDKRNKELEQEWKIIRAEQKKRYQTI